MTNGGDSWNDGDGVVVVKIDMYVEHITLVAIIVLLVVLCDDNGKCLYYTLTPADVNTFPTVHLRTTEGEVDTLTINNWKWIPLINSR